MINSKLKLQALSFSTGVLDQKNRSADLHFRLRYKDAVCRAH